MKTKLISLLFYLLLGCLSLSLQGQSLVSELGRYEGYNLNDYRGAALETLYLSMRDEVQLAANLYLPKDLEEGKQIPTILYLTRYHRAFGAARGIAWLNPYFYSTVGKEEIRFFTQKGYAMMVVDVRGTGASTGVRSMEFSEAEIEDGREIVDWIIAQPWSNGKVGSTGISYLGSTAQLLLVNQHPNVKAVINRSGVFDVYADVSFPGGVKLDKFMEVWRNSTYALDNYTFDFFGNTAGLVLRGPFPVKADRDREILAKAKEDHRGNFDIFPPLEELTFRDELVPALGESIDDYSPHTHMAAYVASQTPIFIISGWYDGANARAAVHNYLSEANTQRLLLGPWDHGPKEFISPFDHDDKVRFDVYTEMLRFFDYHLYGIDNGIKNELPVAYYNMGQEEWRQTENWPPTNSKMERLYLSGDQQLAEQPSAIASGVLEHRIDTTQHTGDGSRWNSLTPAFRYEKIGYPDWQERAANLLTFSGPRLTSPLDITGHPLVRLTLKVDATDATVFVYLQDKAPDGSLTYITEGQFRAIHRKESDKIPPYPVFGPYHTFEQADAMAVAPGEDFSLCFDLLPVSYTLPAGHQLQLAIAGADFHHFEVLEDGPSYLKVVVEEGVSFLELPVVK
jgi:putative CocE/NonD family hydrolase